MSKWSPQYNHLTSHTHTHTHTHTFLGVFHGTRRTAEKEKGKKRSEAHVTVVSSTLIQTSLSLPQLHYLYIHSHHITDVSPLGM